MQWSFFVVDLAGGGCDGLDDGYFLKDADATITVFHEPQYNTLATRDRCEVTIRSNPGTRIEYLVENIQFQECGVTIYLYDIPNADVNPFVSATFIY